MSNSKEFQSAYQRWEMTSFDAPRRTQAPAAPPAAASRAAAATISLPTAQEIEAIREAARQEGYAEGLAEGREAGHADGLAQGREEGLEQGREEGYQDGLAQGREDASAELVHVRELAVTFGAAVTEADEAIAHDVLELALHLARNMVRTALDVKPELILAVVREAIDYLPTLQQPAILTLHPDDALIVKGSIGHELDKSGWRVVEDANVARGGCRVDTASNQIDAQIAGRWQRLTHALGRDVEWLA